MFFFEQTRNFNAKTTIHKPSWSNMFRSFIVFAIFVGGFLFSVRVFGQNIDGTITMNFELFSSNDGLSQGFVRCIYQDKKGYIWFCTKDGLNKYDGYRVTVYRNNKEDKYSLPESYVTAVTEGDHGEMWIGTLTKGVCVFDQKKGTFHSIKNTDSYGTVEAMYVKNNRIIVALENNIVSLKTAGDSVALPQSAKNAINSTELDVNKLFSYYGLAKYRFQKYQITFLSKDSLYLSDNQNLYLLTYLSNASRWVINKTKIISSPDQAKDILISGRLPNTTKLAITNSNNIYVYNYATSRIESQTHFNNPQFKILTGIITSDHSMIVSTESGNYLFNMLTNSLKKINQSLPQIISISIIDKNNTLWVATGGVGVLKYDDRKHIFPVNPDKLSAIPFVLDVFNSTIYIYPPNPLFDQNEMDKPYYDHLGCLLKKFNTDSNLYNYHHYNKEIHAFILLLKAKKILQNNIEHITFLIEYNSTMKMITIKLDDESIEDITPLPFKNSNNENRAISKLIETKQGIIWFGTDQGLFRLDRNKKTWRTWQHESLNKTSLSSNQIFSIAADPALPDKYLWIGTNGSGVDRLDISANIFTHYTTNEQLPSNVIYGLVDDKSGALWASTSMGLSKITTQKNTAQISIKTFTTDDGLDNNEFSRYQYGHLNDSELILGGVGGMFRFNPEKIKVESYKSNIEFTGLYFYNKLFDYNSDKKIIDCPIQFAHKIVIPPDKNMFTIEFAVIDYIPKNKKRYYYFLEGYTDHWIETVNNANNVTFTNLPAGKYTLYIRATVNDGEWNNNDVASINIVVKSHWWFTWWFKSVVLICFLAFLYLIYKARAKRLGKVKAMRNQIAGDLHDEIGSTLSSVNIASRMMINKMDTNPEDLTALISRISDNTSKMMESMNDIVWAIDNKSDQLHNVLTRLLNFAAETLEPSGCKIEFRNEVDLRKIKLNPAEKKNIYLILKEVINNIAKHAAANDILISVVQVRKNYLMLSIKDNGKGFEKEQESNKMSSGHGINSISMRAKEQNWKLSINSIQGAGTEIKIVMKTHKYHWN